MTLFDVTDKVIVLTGGDRGIGFVLAHGLAKAGANVTIANRDIDAGRQAAATLRAEGLRVSFIPCELSDGTSINYLVDEVVDRFGTVDALVNNAATRVTATALEHNATDWNRLMEVNVGGLFFLAQAVARVLTTQQKQGSIVNISSLFAKRGLYNRVSYIASKGAVDSLTIALAMEWAQYGIRVNGIAPGSVETRETSEQMRKSEQRYKAIIDHVPLRRHATPEDLLGSVIFLISDASSYITGQTLIVDGGWSLVALPMKDQI